jgi:hypothetical protein
MAHAIFSGRNPSDHSQGYWYPKDSGLFSHVEAVFVGRLVFVCPCRLRGYDLATCHHREMVGYDLTVTTTTSCEGTLAEGLAVNLAASL